MSAEAIYMEDRLLRDQESRARLVRLTSRLLHDEAFIASLEKEGTPEEGRPAAEVLAPFILL